MKKEKYYIGIDGGGTKTHAVIANTGGEILAEHFAGPTNFQIIGEERSTEIILELIESCRESVECLSSEVASVVLGITGAGRIAEQRNISLALKTYARQKKIKWKRLIVESDARIALEGAFKGEPGIILIAGTGSIAFGKDAKGKVHRVGGWGRILGDEGSGYFLGRLGLSAVAHHLDERGKKTKLTSMIARKFKLSSQAEIINAVYKKEFDVASIAPLVLKAAAQKDEISRMIVEHAAFELADHIRVISGKIASSSSAKIKSKIHLALIGGLLANDTVLANLLREYVHARFQFIEIIPPMATPAYGAVVMGMKSLKTLK